MRKFLAGLMAFLAFQIPSVADETEQTRLPHELPESAYEDYIVAIQTDNDFYFSGRDEEYTHGQRLNVTLPIGKEPKWMKSLLDWVPFGSPNKGRRYNWVYGQKSFTPQNVFDPAVQVGERPFTGHMFLGIGYADPGDYTTDFVNLSTGWTGKASLAKLAQEVTHDIRSQRDPLGWQNQLRTEPTLMLQAMRIFAGEKGSRFGGRFFDITPYGGFSIGSPNTFSKAGLTLRIGNAIKREAAGALLLHPQMAAHDLYLADDRLAFNLVAGIEGYANLYDLTLDGGLIRDDRGLSVDSKTFTAQYHLGFAAYWKHWRLGYSHVFRTKEYTTQPRKHNYGSITLSWYF